MHRYPLIALLATLGLGSTPVHGDLIGSAPTDFTASVAPTTSAILNAALTFGDLPPIAMLSLSGAPGTAEFDFTSGSAGFDETVNYLTNGLNDSIDLVITLDTGTYTRHLTEAEFFTRDLSDPDFQGDSVNNIHVRINKLELVPFIDDDAHVDLRVSFDMNFEVLGSTSTPVPAPGAAGLVLLGCGTLLTRRPEQAA